MKEYKKKTRNLNDSLSFIIVFQFTIMVIKNMLVSSNTMLESINGILNPLIIALIFLMYVAFILKNFRQIKVFYKQIFLIIAIVLFWLLSYVNNPMLFMYSYLNNDLRDFIVYSLPVLIFIPMLKDTNTLLRYFNKASYFMFIGACIAGTLSILGDNSSNVYTAYNMSFGRNAMIPCLFLFSKSLTEKNKVDFLLATFLLSLIVLLGSRFPILCVATLLIIKILLLPRNKKKLVYLYWFIAISLILYLNVSSIASFLISILDKLGIQSRTLKLLSMGMGSYTSGRTEIHQQLYAAINKSPIWGYGAGGGNIILNNGLSHGFLIDTFANIGYVFGSLFLLLSGIYIYRAYRLSQRNSGGELIIVLICSFVPISTIQLGLWSAEMFWFTIALSMCLTRRSNKHIHSINLNT